MARRSHFCRWLPLGLLSLSLTLGGCSWDWSKLRGEGFTDENAGWSRGLRKGDGDSSPLGTSQKALEIERNLGVQ